MKLIDKAAVTLEIKKRISLFQKEKKKEKWSIEASQMNVITLGARIAMLEEILSFLDTIEVKEPVSISAVAMPSDSSLWVDREDLEQFKDGDYVNIQIIKSEKCG